MVTIGPRDEALAAALQAVRSSGGIVIVGPGGVGKSTMIGDVVEVLQPEEVVRIAVDELADHREAPTILLDALTDRPLAGDTLESQIFAATEQRRVAVVLDGADSGIEDILALVASVPVGPEGPWVIVSSRVRPMSPAMPVVHLPPFDVTTAGGLAEADRIFRTWYATSGGPPAALDSASGTVRSVLVATGGLPLVIRVAAGAAAAVGLDAAKSLIDTSGLDAFARCIGRSVELLTPPERRLFTALGVTAGSTDPITAAALTQMTPEAATSALGGLVRHNLIDPIDSRYRLLPPIHRYTIAAFGTDTDLQLRHRRWCRELVDHPDRIVLEHDADIRLAIGRCVDDPSCATQLTIRLTHALVENQRHHRAAELLDAVLDNTELMATIAPDDHVELLRLAAIVALESGGSRPAERFLDAADALAPTTRSPAKATTRLMSLRASLLHNAGDASRALDLTMRTVEAAREIGDDFNVLQSSHDAATMLQDTGRFAEADLHAASVIGRCDHALQWLADIASSTRAAIALERGDRATAIAIARRLLTDASSLGIAVDAEFLLMLADPSGHAASLTAAPEMYAAPPGPWMVYLEAQVALAIRSLVRGDPETAMVLASDITVVAESLPLFWMRLEGLLLTGDAAIIVDDRIQALAAYGQALTLSHRHRHLPRIADALDGLARLTPPGPARTATLAHATGLRTSIGAARRPRPWLPALDAPKPRTTTATADGASLTDAEIERTLSAATASAQTNPTGDIYPLELLTPAEQRVAALAAQGVTNREIGDQLHIARRTVETHLAHVFQKLSIHNRTQLAAKLATTTR